MDIRPRRSASRPRGRYPRPCRHPLNEPNRLHPNPGLGLPRDPWNRRHVRSVEDLSCEQGDSLCPGPLDGRGHPDRGRRSPPVPRRFRHRSDPCARGECRRLHRCLLLTVPKPVREDFTLLSLDPSLNTWAYHPASPSRERGRTDMAQKPNSIVHVEFHSTAPEKTKAFLSDVFGWKFQDIDRKS